MSDRVLGRKLRGLLLKRSPMVNVKNWYASVTIHDIRYNLYSELNSASGFEVLVLSACVQHVLYCLDVPNRDECPGADLNSGLLSKFTLRPSRDYTCTTCWNRRLLIVDYLLPKVHPVFCPCFGCFVPRLLLYCSTSQTYQNVPKEPFFLMIDENTGDAI